jgi:hypothetical protein
MVVAIVMIVQIKKGIVLKKIKNNNRNNNRIVVDY